MAKLSRRDFLLLSGLSSASLLFGPVAGSQSFGKESAGPVSHPDCDPWVELDLKNMTWNLSQIRTVTRAKVMAVIKANAYGHGLVEVGKHLEKAGVDFLMVGKLDEALLLRKNGVSVPILNFGPFSNGECEEIIRNTVSQSVFDEKARSLNEAGLKLGKKARVHIHVDTGMGRMGIQHRDALPYIDEVSKLKGLSIEGISTTLTEDDDFDREQLERFLSLCREAEKGGISLGLKHAASSDGLLDLPSSHLDMVRPGIAIYGYYPSEKTQKEDRLALRPVLQLKSRVAAVKTLLPGDSVSYHRLHTAQKKERIAIVPVGYSDGYPPNVIGKASVLIRGRRYPLLAAVTANHCTVLLEENSSVSPGDEVVLLGSQGKEKITADELASWAGVSSYKILIALNPQLPRIITSH
ncbi:MAG: alanine racemase [Candidatus Aminicenantes bacterium]|nr:alanine racemase [Candidatus Aminicenantes bacterium]